MLCVYVFAWVKGARVIFATKVQETDFKTEKICKKKKSHILHQAPTIEVRISQALKSVSFFRTILEMTNNTSNRLQDS